MILVTQTDDIIEMFGLARIKECFHSVYQELVEFVTKNNLNKYVRIDTELLNVAIYNYFGNMYEFCKFHGYNYVNAEKIISHRVYWLLKYKPLQIFQTPETYTKNLITVNERFLLLYVLDYLSDRLGDTHILVHPDKDMTDFSERLFHFFVAGIQNVQGLESVINSFLFCKEGGVGF